jgi:hypothetical protein
MDFATRKRREMEAGGLLFQHHFPDVLWSILQSKRLRHERVPKSNGAGRNGQERTSAGV